MKKSKFLIAILAFSPGFLLANNASFWNQIEKHTYVGLKGGYSISTTMNFQPDYGVQKQFIWVAFEHAQFTSNMNTSGLYGAFMGYSLNSNISFDVAYDYRNNFQWDRASDLYMPSNPFAPIRSIGERWRAKDIRIQTLLFGVNLKPCVNWNGIIPYATAGIGAAWNTINSFENYDIDPRTFNLELSGNTKTNFAWKIGAGVNYMVPCYQQFMFSLGYQFVDVGTLQTSTSFVDHVDGTQGSINPFSANHVQMNEVFLSATYFLA